MSTLTPEIFTKWPQERQDAWIRNKLGHIATIQAEQRANAREITSIERQVERYRTYRYHAEAIAQTLANYRGSVASSQRQIWDYWVNKRPTSDLGKWKRREILRGIRQINQAASAGEAVWKGAVATGITFTRSYTQPRMLSITTPEDHGPLGMTAESWLGRGRGVRQTPEMSGLCKAILDPELTGKFWDKEKLMTCLLPKGHLEDRTRDSLHWHHNHGWVDSHTVGYAR